MPYPQTMPEFPLEATGCRAEAYGLDPAIQWIRGKAIQDITGSSPDTVRSYANKGLPLGNPAPSGSYGVGGVIWWDKDKIREWQAQRKGPGYRSDLK
jgi:hypothetical protein